MLSCFSHVQLYVAPRTAVHQAPLSMEFSRQESWSGLPCTPPGDLPDPGTKPESPVSPALAGRFFTMSVTGKPNTHTHTYIFMLLLSHSVMSDPLRPHGLQHASLPCPSPSPRACSNSYPLSQWCHPTISFSVIPFSSCLLPFLASGTFSMSQLFASSGPSIGALNTMNLWIYIYVHRRICFPTVEAFAGDIIQDRVRIYADLVSWVKSLGTSKRAIHSIASITRVESWEIKTGTMEWRRLSRLNSQHPGILPAEHGPASSSHVCWCYLSWKQACRTCCSLRADGKLIKDKEDVYTFPQSEMCKKKVSAVFAAIWLLLFKLLCDVIYELKLWGWHPGYRGIEVVVRERTKATKMYAFIMLLWLISESL